ncbi:MAG TPA: amidohydrolase family protein [Ktedonobacteraceae bacterium]|nr:amidohydrolase family protein [Ktedonobacteraceae bacterium]
MHHNHEMAYEITDPKLARRTVLDLASQVDFIKCIYDGDPGTPEKLPLPVLQAIVAAAHEMGKKVLVHVKTGTDLVEAVEAGADGIEHTFLPRDPADLSEAEAIAALLARTGTYFCPTLVTWEQIGRGGDRTYLDELAQDEIISANEVSEIAARPFFNRPFPHHPADESLARFHYGMQIMPILRDAGVKIVAGSDVALSMSLPRALLRELQLLAKAGLPNHDVIIAATRHAAEKIGQGANTATITAGAVADAVLLNANPLIDIMHLIRPAHRVATIQHGHLVAR